MAFCISFFVIVAAGIERFRKKQSLPPVTAILGYSSALYLWTVFPAAIHPFFILLVPALHSLQYILFVVKYKHTEYALSPIFEQKPSVYSLLYFVLIGVALGALGFFFVPMALDYYIPLNTKVFGPEFFLFCAYIIINIHHYFIDNVIWRRENKSISQYL